MKVWVLGINDQMIGIYRSRAALVDALERLEGRYPPLSSSPWEEECWSSELEEVLT